MALLGSLSLLQGGARASQVTTQQEQPYQAPSGVFNSVLAAAVALSTVVTGQEQPYHPAPQVNASVPSSPQNAVIAAVVTTQERVLNPPSWTTAPGPVVAAATAPPSGISVVTTQEQPYHPLPRVGLSAFPPNPPYPSNVRTTQEQPDHPGAQTHAATAFSPNFPRASNTLTVQEQPGHPGPQVTPSRFSPNFPRASNTGTSQEQPYHPLPQTQPSAFSPNLPRASNTGTVQELPDHPQPRAWSSALGPNPPRPSRVLTAQEQPWEPFASWAKLGLPPVTFSIVRTVATVQEGQLTPPSWTTWPGPVASTTITLPPGTISVSSVQEQPYHPPSWAQIGTPPIPIVLSAVSRNVRSVQEQPDFTPGWARIGVNPVAPVVTPVSPVQHVVTTQEQPDLPATQVEMSIPGPNQGPPQGPATVTTQEVPDHPQTRIFGHPPPQASQPAALAVSAATVQTTQEQPDVKPSWAKPSVLGGRQYLGLKAITTVQETPDVEPSWARFGLPAVSFSIIRTVSTVQEQPDVKPSVTQASVLGGQQYLGLKAVTTVQEQPDVKPSWAQFGLPPVTLSIINTVTTVQEPPSLGSAAITPSLPKPLIVTPVPPSTSYIVTRQEIPDHPAPTTLGAPGPFAVAPPQPIITPPQGGGGKRKKPGPVKYASPIRLMTAGDAQRQKIAMKSRKKDVSKEEIAFLLNLLDEDDEEA